MFELPFAVRQHIEERLDTLVKKHGQSALHQAAARLSQRYLRGGQNHLSDAFAVPVYLGTRLPATYAAASHCLHQLTQAYPDFAPTQCIDLGAGPGSVALAAHACLNVTQFVLFEAELKMRQAGQELFAAQGLSAQWQAGHLPHFPTLNENLTGDTEEGLSRLWTAGYVLNELTPAQRTAFYTACVEQVNTRDVLLIIEPGTPVGYEHILSAREAFLHKGWQVLAPCTHGTACPLPEGDWCHFAERLSRSHYHRLFKGGARGFEDEKFAYLAVTPKKTTLPVVGRLLRQPRQHKGHVQLRLCTPEGIQEPVVGKKHKAYKRLKKAKWGDGLDAQTRNSVLS